MNGIKFFPKDLQIKNKRIILRVDFNVPIHEKKILDPTRILLVIPFLQDLIKRESKIIIISHLGRPKGKQDNRLSLSPVFEYLKKEIRSKIFIDIIRLMFCINTYTAITFLFCYG